MRYFISAGEASGDIHASHLMSGILKYDSRARFVFLGGDLMSAVAGCEPVIHYKDMAYMGFSEVFRHLGEIMGNFSKAKAALEKFRPDALVLVDYPSFNLKLASYARKFDIPVYYYISPKVWAWKEWRVKSLRRDVRRVYSILPFEEVYFRKRGVAVEYVGNPSVEEVDARLASAPDVQEFRMRHGLPDKPLIALVPGSRKGEIRNNLPVMDAVARLHPDYQAVVAAAPGIDRRIYGQYSSLPAVEGCTLDLMRVASAALVTSGTATLECALAGTPQVVCYRANGSRLSYNIMKRLIKVPYVSLPNLIAGYEVIPEMLLHRCTGMLVDNEIENVLPGGSGREAQLRGYEAMRKRLGTRHAADNAAKHLCSDLREVFQLRDGKRYASDL